MDRVGAGAGVLRGLKEGRRRKKLGRVGLKYKRLRVNKKGTLKQFMHIYISNLYLQNQWTEF